MSDQRQGSAKQIRMGAGYYTRDELLEFEWGALGDDVLIKRDVTIPFTRNTYIGSHVRIDDFTVIVASSADHPVRLGSHVFIANHCHLAGSDGIVMEDFSTLAPGCMIFSGSDDYTGQRLTGPTIPRDLIGGPQGLVTIGRHVILGAGTVVHPDLTIPEGCSVGSLGLVNRTLQPWGMYVGIPVRRIRDRSQDLLVLEHELLRREAEAPR